MFLFVPRSIPVIARTVHYLFRRLGEIIKDGTVIRLVTNKETKDRQANGSPAGLDVVEGKALVIRGCKA